MKNTETTNKILGAIKETQTPKVYYVHGFGEVGESNLLFGVRRSEPDWTKLKVGESATIWTRDSTDRITRRA